MNQPPESPITILLHDARQGDAGAVEALLEKAYAELGAIARIHLAGERNGHTLQPTALVHEVWLKLAGSFSQVSDRTHFFALASRSMRRVLTDHARARGREKRAGGRVRVTFCTNLVAPDNPPVDYLDLEDALSRLESLNERHARVVELRVLGGLTIAETAVELAVSHATIERDWFTARAWLRLQLSPEQ
ncbi:MAG: RNA polymerase sigma factor (TIGR02999 family) [Planctomycetota bacterium]|jgi:RNA polymerase sigma factor (TIGR02999 family)